MSLWQANTLHSMNDVVQRAVFRFVWCAVGWLLIAPPLMAAAHFQLLPCVTLKHLGATLAAVFLIPLLAMAFDATCLARQLMTKEEKTRDVSSS